MNETIRKKSWLFKEKKTILTIINIFRGINSASIKQNQGAIKRKFSEKWRKLLENLVYDTEMKNSIAVWKIKLRMFLKNTEQKYRAIKKKKEN